jgi:hypothetical protein
MATKAPDNWRSTTRANPSALATTPETKDHLYTVE